MFGNQSSATHQTAAVWSAYEPEITRSFFGFPPLRPYLVTTAFGPELAEKHSENRWWAEDIVSDLYLRDRAPKRVLSICCGFGAVEQRIVGDLGSIEHCLAIDLARGAVAEAARRATALGLDDVIHYEVADLNGYDWSGPTYDLVVANGALHHLAQLERVLDGVMHCLNPGGVLYANEHIGARHQDFPQRQIELINATAYLVPPGLRCRRALRTNPFSQPSLRRLVDVLLGNADLSGVHAGWSPAKRALAGVLQRISLPPRRRFGPIVESNKRRLLRTDPSEGVSSDRIVDAVRARYREVHVHPYGGAVLTYALDRAFYEGFDPSDTGHQRLLRTLCSLEAFLVDSGELADEHAIIVAVKDGRSPSHGTTLGDPRSPQPPN